MTGSRRALCSAGRPSDSGICGEVLFDDLYGLFGVAHVRAVARGLEDAQRALQQAAAQVVANFERRDGVLRALHDERGDGHTREVVAVVREEGGLREAARDLRVRGAEALDQLRGQLRPPAALP